VEVDCHGQVQHYEVLAILEFDSDRKRMSIICRCGTQACLVRAVAAEPSTRLCGSDCLCMSAPLCRASERLHRTTLCPSVVAKASVPQLTSKLAQMQVFGMLAFVQASI